MVGDGDVFDSVCCCFGGMVGIVVVDAVVLFPLLLSIFIYSIIIYWPFIVLVAYIPIRSDIGIYWPLLLLFCCVYHYSIRWWPMEYKLYTA